MSDSLLPPYRSTTRSRKSIRASQVLSPHPIPTVVNLLTNTQSVSTRHSFHRPPPDRPPPISSNHSLQWHHWTGSPTALQYISWCTQSRPASESPNLLHYDLHVHLQTRSIMPSWRSLSPLHLSFEVQLESRSITASECSCTFNRSQPPMLCPNSCSDCRPADLQTRSIMVSEFLCAYHPCKPPNAPQNFLDLVLRVHLWICEIIISRLTSCCISSTGCSQSRYAMCWWAPISIHRYINVNTNWLHEFWILLNNN